MPKPRLLLLAALVLLFLSCKNDHTHNYSIKDFRKSIQPHLVSVVANGIVSFYDSSLENMATDNELRLLGQSEHPLLRSWAFIEMLDRKSFNDFDIVMNHLDDTAIVATDHGEFGVFFRTVSDNILDFAEWANQEAKNKTIDEVLTKHNYLRSAYWILLEIEPQEKYYLFIKDMATRPRRLSFQEYELGFDEIEFALYGLAKFRKKEDVQIIKEKLMRHVWELSDHSFRLMKEFPDTAYMDVLQAYHRRQFYNLTNRPYGFTGFYADRAAPEDFIQALVVQQNERSAMLLDTMLNLLPQQKCMPDMKNILDDVILEIWKRPCPAYARLREKIRTKAEHILKGRIVTQLEMDVHPIDAPKKIIRW